MRKVLIIVGIILLVAGAYGVYVGKRVREQADQQGFTASITSEPKEKERYRQWVANYREEASTYFLRGGGSLAAGLAALVIARFSGRRSTT